MLTPVLKNELCYTASRTILRQPDGTLKIFGSGTDGTVWATDAKSALKILIKKQTYEQEVECYRRLHARQITEICGYAVPRLLNYSNTLLAIEMSVVQPPRILDFGKVTLDSPGDFSQQTMAYWHEQQEELWGEHWKTIRKILSRLRSLGIYYSDPNPYNITPEDWDPSL